MPGKGRRTIWQYPDPAIRNTIHLKEMAAQHNLPSPITQQIDQILSQQIGRIDYCEKITSGASKELANIENETNSHPWDKVYEEGKTIWHIDPISLSGNGTAQLLKSLVSIGNCRRALEIGMFTGFGALAMAEALPADGCVVACEFDSYIVSLARGLLDKSPHGKKVTIKTGPAKDTLTNLAEKGEQFDLVFLDADKPGYKEYYNMLLDKNILAPRGTIVVDNTLLYGTPYAPEVGYKYGDFIKEFDEYVASDQRVHKVLLPVSDGIMIIRRLEAVEGSV